MGFVHEPWPERLELAGTALAALLFVLLPLELWRRWRAGRLGRTGCAEMLASASPLLPTLLVAGPVVAWVTVVYGVAATLAPWRIPTNAATVLLALVVVDFLYYWDHRCAHAFRPYWATCHSVHHSSPQFDQTTGLRVSFVDGFVSPWFYVPAVLLGFDPALVIAAFAVIIGYQQWLHTEAIGRLRWLDGWLNTPANHRVHHATQSHYLDRNFGAVLMAWDRLFGTYAPETETPRYGLTRPLRSSNPWHVHTIEMARLLEDLRGSSDLPDLLRRLVRMPARRG
ncbi:MAG: sterol desaturase family protein [Steroidobacteraceae bacterium]|nr:sterol desaturase family protein [Steroidobacteraceae bacterium]